MLLNRNTLITGTLAGLALAGLTLLPACAQGQRDKAGIEEIVRNYILSNPEIIEEALIALSEKEQRAKQETAQRAIAEYRDQLFFLDTDYSIGPADAPVTVVEFFDYRCGFCRRSADWVLGLPEAYDGQVRVVFKELPIFRGISETAARAALAAGKQGKYLEMHQALMAAESNDLFTEEFLDQTAQDLGVDVARMRADMQSAAVRQQLADMQRLAAALGLNATPGFFIGDTYVEGANTPAIERAIQEALRG
jgi:protein-disulfide isomerase